MGSELQTLTFLFTDIEGSTRLWERHPDLMRAANERHEAIIRQAVNAHGGKIFRTVGDAFCASFPAAPEAVASAVEAQCNLYNEPWNLETPLCVRMALHTGEAEEHEGDYIGASLNHIGRLLPASHGGQTLLTLVTQELSRDSLPEGVSLLDLGEHHFRDLVHPEHVFQLVIEGLPSTFPPIKSLDFYPNNLPTQLNSFVGRERELEEVRRLVSSSRLVTLTGPGGTGKTRLALQVALEVMDQFPDGIWFIELAPLTNAGLIYQAISTELKIREQPNHPLNQVIAEALRPQKLLLILDNCEHLIEACARICDELLHLCPGIKILTSSRETLGTNGEAVFRVPSLALPADEQQIPPAELEHYEAIRLFTDRASAYDSGFKLSSQNAAAILQICQRLDGIPLAIELAAARVKLLTPEQIASRLDDRFRLLTGGSRTALPRQQTLEALFDWSYELLSEPEQIFFRRCSVFSGGWDWDGVEALYTDDEKDDADPFELLAQLVNKSLVVVDNQEKEAHYRMLETTRQYAQKKLVDQGEAFEIRQRHMRYYAGIAQDAFRSILFTGQLWTTRHKDWLKRELDNIRMAQQWALDHDLETALRFTTGLSFYWGMSGAANEMRRYTRQVVQRAESQTRYQGEISSELSGLLARGWIDDSILSENLGQNQDALDAAQKALAYAHHAADPLLQGISYMLLAEAAALTGKADLADTNAEKSIETARQAETTWPLGMALSSSAAYVHIPLGNFQRAKLYADEALQVFQTVDDPWGIAMVSVVEGMVAFHYGDYISAQVNFTSGLKNLEAIGNRYFANVARSGLADTARLQKQYKTAIPLYIDIILSWRTLGNLGAIARCLECLGFIAIDQAKDLSEEDEQRGQFIERAGLLFGVAEAIRSQNRTSMTPLEQTEYDQKLAELRAMIGEQSQLQAAFDTAWEQGRKKSLEQIVAYLKE